MTAEHTHRRDSTPTSPGPDQLVHRLFAKQARSTPDQAALLEPGRPTVSYRELDARANQLAWALLDEGVTRGDIVGLRVSRSVDYVVAVLGVLKAGAGYLALEERLPDERLLRMVHAGEVRFVLTLPPLTWTPRMPQRRLDDGWLIAFPDSDPALPADSADVMYVPFTSGSTGYPKGVAVPHRAVPGFFTNADYAPWAPGMRSLMHSALSWDAHLLEMFPPLLTGGTIVLFPGDPSDPVDVVRFAAAHGVDVLWLTAAAFNTVVDTDPGALANLRCVLTGGEPMSNAHLRRARRSASTLTIVNGYGPVECTVFATCHVTDADDELQAAAPIGKPVGDRRVYVLDADRCPVPDGVVGELCIGGPAVAHGYLGDPGLTAERFIPDSFGEVAGSRLFRTGDLVRRRPDSSLEFLGRIDRQLKIRGFRIEPEEIERRLRQHPRVIDAAVDRDTSGQRLVAYLVVHAVRPDVAQLRDLLGRSLPEHMIPSQYVLIDRLPLAHTGKLDRSALPPVHACRPLQEGAAPAKAPRTALQRRVAELWSQALGTGLPNLTDNFVDIGGHSLTGARVVFTLRADMMIALTLTELFNSQNLEDFCQLIESRISASREPGETQTGTSRQAGHPNGDAEGGTA